MVYLIRRFLYLLLIFLLVCVCLSGGPDCLCSLTLNEQVTLGPKLLCHLLRALICTLLGTAKGFRALKSFLWLYVKIHKGIWLLFNLVCFYNSQRTIISSGAQEMLNGYNFFAASNSTHPLTSLRP